MNRHPGSRTNSFPPFSRRVTSTLDSTLQLDHIFSSMNLLLITPFFPLPADSGGNTRTFNLLKQLAAVNTRVILAVVTAESIPTDLKAQLHRELPHVQTIIIPLRNTAGEKSFYYLLNFLGLDRFFCYRGIKRQLRQIIRDHHIDLIQTDYTQTARYLPFGHTPSVLAFIEFRSQVLARERATCRSFFGRIKASLRLFLLSKEELSHCSRYNRFICVSDTDRAWLLQHQPNLCVDVIENGVDCSLYTFSPSDTEPKGLYFLGWFMNRQNVIGLDHFLDAIWPLLPTPRPDFIVIGKDLDARHQQRLEYEGIHYRGFLSLPELQQTTRGRILITPLLSGSGTRLKILEAMAMGKPVVSTRIGAEGLAGRHGEHLLLADAPVDFAHSIGQLLSDRKLREQLTLNARALAEARYDWKRIADHLMHVHRQALEKS